MKNSNFFGLIVVDVLYNSSLPGPVLVVSI